MRNLVFILAVLISGFSGINAQLLDRELSLFDDFKDAQIVYKDGSKSQSKLNYNFWLNQFCFLDEKTDMVHLIKGVDKIDYYEIAGKKYKTDGKKLIEYNTDGFFTEIIYKKNVTKASQGAYGAPTETASTQSYFPIIEAWKRGEYDISNLRIGKLQVEYKINEDGKVYEFDNAKQFQKIYPQYQKEIKKYIKNNSVNFSNIDQVRELKKYVDSIK